MFSLKPKEGGGAAVPPPAATGNDSIMKIALAVCIVAIALVGYSGYSTRVALEEKITALEKQHKTSASNIVDLQKESTELGADLNVVSKKLGVTAQDLDAARKYAERLRQEQLQAKEQLASELATKANSTDVAAVAQDTSNKLAAVQQDANTKITGVSGEVKTVATNLESTRQDLAASRREITDVRTTLSQQIARNSGELNELRRKGERDFFEFDIKKDKKNPMQRVADVQLELKETDAKRQKYNIVIHVDDSRLEKKDRTANEPVQFLVGRDKLRYEVVVNFVDKDRIRGYMSAPKDKALAAERPGFRPPEK
jgi:chromosome segregation ATPase